MDPPASPAAAPPPLEDGVSLTRLYLLRGMFLLWAVAGFAFALPPLIDHAPDARGMLPSMLAGLWVTGFIGLRHPLLMLPIFLFEIFWKAIWLLFFGLPQWLAGGGSPRLGEDLLGIGSGPILFALVIPWGYVWRRYVKAPAERWR